MPRSAKSYWTTVTPILQGWSRRISRKARRSSGDVGAETRAIMGAISAMLNEVGLTLEDVVKAEVHLADLSDFDAMDAAYREYFPPKVYPARTTTESPKLFGGSKVEVTVQARLRNAP